MREIRTSGLTRGEAANAPLLLYRFNLLGSLGVKVLKDLSYSVWNFFKHRSDSRRDHAVFMS